MSATKILAAALAVGLTGFTAEAETVAPEAVAFAEGAVATSLTGVPGDVAEGRKAFANRKLGNCLACHANPDMPDESFHGETGPSLEGVADRYDEAHLRGLVINSKMTFEHTMMPGFYNKAGLERPASKFEGQTILTAQQVEDVVAYLGTLK